MGKETTIQDHEGNPSHIRVTSEDGKSSVLYTYENDLISNLTGNHKGTAVEYADHVEGETTAYEYDNSFLANLLNDHRGEKK